MVKVKYYDNNGSVTASLSYDGRRERITRKTAAELKPLVKARVNELNAAESRKMLGIAETVVQGDSVVSRMNIAGALRHHVEQRSLKTSKKNLSTDKHYFARFYKFIFERGRDYVDEITLADLQAFRGVLKAEGQKSSSINRCMAGINGFLSACEELEWVPVAVGRKLKKLPEDKPDVIAMTPEQRALIWTYFVSMDRFWAADFIEVLGGTIARPIELARADVKDLDVGRKLLRVWTAKGGKVRERHIPLAASVLEILVRNAGKRPGHEPLFVNSKGNRIDPTRFSELVREGRRAFGLDERLVPYGIRRDGITSLSDDDVQIGKIQIVAGHSRPTTTMGYVRLPDKSLHNVVNLLEVRNQKAASKVKQPEGKTKTN
ncbi:tyrosine-type recombinase/integrase [Bdellovibrio bacteriovorus]|uniref:tyrosine-type recombinase/integrase n=1 Tax=Bdellovibrio bacteriovorus TaxID=959 RepID=UPI003AA88550